MNEQNSLENRLREWEPRRPSAKLYTRLFAATEELAQPSFSFADVRRWIAPALGSAFLLMITLPPRDGGGIPHPPAASADMIGAAGGALLGQFESFYSVHNTLPQRTVEWSFGTSVTQPPVHVDFTNSPLKQ